MKEYGILVENLNKKFADFQLNHISFHVPKGCIVGFIGENGAGKSTVINLILDEIKKDSGRIEILGKDHTDSSVKKEIGVVFDECSFHDVFTALDMGKIFSGVYGTWDEDFFRQKLRKFQLPPNKGIGRFSKGMKMKLSILCAMAHHPKVLLLDEATTGLDPLAREDILDMFLEYMQDEENSLLFSSHITSDIEKIADYVVFLHQGTILFEEQKDNLLYQYGIAKCGKEQMASIAPADYLIARETAMCTEFLVKDKISFQIKYKNIVVDNATLETIMLFYRKGDAALCED